MSDLDKNSNPPISEHPSHTDSIKSLLDGSESLVIEEQPHLERVPSEETRNLNGWSQPKQITTGSNPWMNPAKNASSPKQQQQNVNYNAFRPFAGQTPFSPLTTQVGQPAQPKQPSRATPWDQSPLSGISSPLSQTSSVHSQQGQQPSSAPHNQQFNNEHMMKYPGMPVNPLNSGNRSNPMQINPMGRPVPGSNRPLASGMGLVNPQAYMPPVIPVPLAGQSPQGPTQAQIPFMTNLATGASQPKRRSQADIKEPTNFNRAWDDDEEFSTISTASHASAPNSSSSSATNTNGAGNPLWNAPFHPNFNMPQFHSQYTFQPAKPSFEPEANVNSLSDSSESSDSDNDNDSSDSEDEHGNEGHLGSGVDGGKPQDDTDKDAEAIRNELDAYKAKYTQQVQVFHQLLSENPEFTAIVKRIESQNGDLPTSDEIEIRNFFHGKCEPSKYDGFISVNHISVIEELILGKKGDMSRFDEEIRKMPRYVDTSRKFSDWVDLVIPFLGRFNLLPLICRSSLSYENELSAPVKEKLASASASLKNKMDRQIWRQLTEVLTQDEIQLFFPVVGRFRDVIIKPDSKAFNFCNHIKRRRKSETFYSFILKLKRRFETSFHPSMQEKMLSTILPILIVGAHERKYPKEAQIVKETYYTQLPAFNNIYELQDWFVKVCPSIVAKQEITTKKAKPAKGKKDPAAAQKQNQVDVKSKIHSMINNLLDPAEAKTIGDEIQQHSSKSAEGQTPHAAKPEYWNYVGFADAYGVNADAYTADKHDQEPEQRAASEPKPVKSAPKARSKAATPDPHPPSKPKVPKKSSAAPKAQPGTAIPQKNKQKQTSTPAAPKRPANQSNTSGSSEAASSSKPARSTGPKPSKPAQGNAKPSLRPSSKNLAAKAHAKSGSKPSSQGTPSTPAPAKQSAKK